MNFNKLCSLIILSLLCSVTTNAQQNSPNVILIMADDLGWGDVNYNGSVFATPNLDKMAANGIQFNRFYSASAVCSPTRGSVLTGRNPERLGLVHANVGRLESDETTIAEVLKSNGYATGHFGKWHLGTLTTTIKDSNRGGPGSEAEFSVPWEHGFDVAFSTEAKVPTYNPMKKENSNNHPTSFNDASFYGTAYWIPPSSGVGEGSRVPLNDNLQGDDSRIVMDRALPFMDKAIADDKPFLSVIWFHTPHKPVVLDEEMEAIYGTAAWNAMSNAERQYGSSITAMDVQIGRLRDHLKTLGVADNTMIWFTSDNGPEDNTPTSPGPYRARKRSLFEGGVRVPGLLEWPGVVTSSKETDVPMVTSDYYPTILDLLDIDNPSAKPLDGVSMKTLVVNDMTERNTPIGFRFDGASSYVTDCYKLYKSSSNAIPQLYNLVDDPFETTDIASSNVNLVNNLTIELVAWESAINQDKAYVPSSNRSSCNSSFIPDPNKTYYLDVPAHNLRLAATGENEDAYTTSINTTGADVAWKFVDKGNDYWHLQRAAGGSTPRLRTDATLNADMQTVSNVGVNTYYQFDHGNTSGTHYITLPDGPADFQRLQMSPDGEILFTTTDFGGDWVSWKITEIQDNSQSFIPDPNKTYYLDVPAHNLRLAATGQSEDAHAISINSINAFGNDAEWKFVDKGNGYWHLQRAAGGSTPRLRTDATSNADMQTTNNIGIYTYYRFDHGNTSGTHYITLPDGPPDFQRLQMTPAGEMKFTTTDFDGDWVSWKITEVNNILIPFNTSNSQVDDCTSVNISADASAITVSNLTAAVADIQILDSNNREVARCAFNCGETESFDLPAGTYQITIKKFSAAYAQLCEKIELVTIGDALASEERLRLTATPAVGAKTKLELQQDAKSTMSMKIAPNPVRDQFSVDFQAIQGANYHLSVIDLLSKVIYQQDFVGTAGSMQLNLNSSSWEGGLYFLVLESEVHSEVKQMVVVK